FPREEGASVNLKYVRRWHNGFSRPRVHIVAKKMDFEREDGDGARAKCGKFMLNANTARGISCSIS
ncbi:MAG: hypothetical protein ACRD33_07700, partial [Candidatus Acidiferrales bacterium]